MKLENERGYAYCEITNKRLGKFTLDERLFIAAGEEQKVEEENLYQKVEVYLKKGNLAYGIARKKKLVAVFLFEQKQYHRSDFTVEKQEKVKKEENEIITVYELAECYSIGAVTESLEKIKKELMTIMQERVDGTKIQGIVMDETNAWIIVSKGNAKAWMSGIALGLCMGIIYRIIFHNFAMGMGMGICFGAVFSTIFAGHQVKLSVQTSNNKEQE